MGIPMIRLPWRVSSSGTERGTERIEAFSDGVFAIAITLLILEVKIPLPHALEAHASNAPLNLLQSLIDLWPSYFAYVLSFIVIGIYWLNHHYLFKLFSKTNHMMNLLNLAFLMCISFLPLPTAIFGNYFLDSHNQVVASVFYAFGLLLPAMTWSILWLYGSTKDALIDERLCPNFIKSLSWQYLMSNALYLLAIIACLFSPYIGIAICVGLTTLYMLPPASPQYREGSVSKLPSIPVLS